MNRSPPALLAVLLVLSLTAVPLAADSGDGAAGPSPSTQLRVQSTETADSGLQTVPNTTNRLALDDASRTEYAEPELGFGTTLATTDDRLETDQIRYSIVDRGFDSASDAEQRTRLRDAYERLKAQSDRLESRERRAVRAHANGELSSEQLLQTLLRNYREAAALSDAFAALEDRSDRVSGFSLSVDDERDKLEMHRTEPRAKLEAVTDSRNGNAPGPIAVKTSQNGFAISMLDENYVREAVRFDNRNTTRGTQFDDLMEAYDYTRGLYPWAYETGQSPSFNELTTVQLYLIDIGHDQGRLEAYLDGGTGDIYREVQVLNENSLPVRSTRTHTEHPENLTLTINETGADGPSEVTVSDTNTGDPVSATVSIDGVAVGETGDDGALWYVPPAESYELTVETESGSANVSVTNG